MNNCINSTAGVPQGSILGPLLRMFKTSTHFTSPRTPQYVNSDTFPRHVRHDPILRANPYSEVTDPICRLPLPTLFYRLEALHFADLLRILVRTGASLHPRDFQDSKGRSGHRCNCGALRV
uniref:Uncharacterized protein LOC114340113 n=1 Tax=Diabrotica virgifera virgifera TaxID=50390 RepID=A0A6P7GBM7_DIAVI